MTAMELTQASFASFIRERDAGIVCFVDLRSGRGLQHLERLERLAEGRLDVGAVDVGRCPDIVSDFDVKSIPTTAVVVSRRLAFLESGEFNEATIAAVVAAAVRSRVRVPDGRRRAR